LNEILPLFDENTLLIQILRNPLLLSKMIAVPLSKVHRFCDLFSARFEQNSGEHRYLATLAAFFHFLM
jgi:hypothetical protein